MFYTPPQYAKVVVRRDRSPPAPPPPPPYAERWPALAFLSTPVLPGEDQGAYDTLAEAMFADLEPRDLVEAIWTKEIADLCWEKAALQRARAHLIRRRRQGAVDDLNPRRVVRGSETDKNYRITLEHYGDGDPEAEEKLHEQLARKGMTPLDVLSKVRVDHWEDINRYDEAAVALTARRDRLLREMARRRKEFAARARQAFQETVPRHRDGD